MQAQEEKISALAARVQESSADPKPTTSIGIQPLAPPSSDTGPRHDRPRLPLPSEIQPATASATIPGSNVFPAAAASTAADSEPLPAQPALFPLQQTTPGTVPISASPAIFFTAPPATSTPQGGPFGYDTPIRRNFFTPATQQAPCLLYTSPSPRD